MASEVEKSILQKANQKMSRMGSNYSKVTLTAKNTELTLSGVLTNETYRRPLLKSLNSVAEVRSLVDRIQVIVPKKQMT